MTCGTDGFRFREKFCTSEGGLPTERGFGRRSFKAAFSRNGNPSVPYERKLLSPRKPFNKEVQFLPTSPLAQNKKEVYLLLVLTN